jgi:hypothetical protein
VPIPEDIFFDWRMNMKKVQKQTTPKKSAPKKSAQPKEKSLCLNYLGYVERQDPGIKLMPVLCGLLLLHPNPEIAAMTRRRLSNWIKDCTSEEGMKDIVSSGFERGVPLLQILSLGDVLQKKESGTDEDAKYPITKQVEQFFRDLPPAGKIAIKLYDAIHTAQMELDGNETGCLDKLDDEIKACINDVKTDDPKLNQMLGLAQFMELSRDENSITIVG